MMSWETGRKGCINVQKYNQIEINLHTKFYCVPQIYRQRSESLLFAIGVDLWSLGLAVWMNMTGIIMEVTMCYAEPGGQLGL